MPGATTPSAPTGPEGSSGISRGETAMRSRTSTASPGAWTGSTPCWAGSPRDGSVPDAGDRTRPGGCPPAVTARVTAKRLLTRRPDPCRGIVGHRVVPLSRSAPESGLSRRDPYDVLSRLASRVTSRRDLTLERPNNDRVRDKRSLAPPHVPAGIRRVQSRGAEGLRADHRDPVLADAGGGRPLRAHRGRNRREDRHGPEGRDPPGKRGPGEDGRRGRGRGPHRGASVGRRRYGVPGGREGASADALIQSLLSLPFIRSPRVRPAPAACFFAAIG